MPKRFTLYSSLWTTLLMLALFVFSGLTGFRIPFLSGPPRSQRGGLIWGPRHLQGKVIVLDPGHGGDDPGTLGVGSTSEAENVLAIAQELKIMLEKAGAEVIMTRDSHESPALGSLGQAGGDQLAARVAAANRSKGQIYISLHNDWNDNSSVQGTSVYFYKNQDLELAEALQNSLVRQLKSADLGVKRSNFYVLRNTSMPSALVEVGFLSNPREAALLAKASYRLDAARGLLVGIENYFQAQP